jgi:ferredoxin
MDLAHAEQFGKRIAEKLQMVSRSELITRVDFPGNYPYGGVTQLWSIDFIEVNNECDQCGICAEVCPANAVDSANSRIIDKEKCITCCACIKKCPKGAKSIKDSPVKEAAARLNRLYSERKEPVIFI